LDSSGNGLTLTDYNSDYPLSATSEMGDGSLYNDTGNYVQGLYRVDAGLPASFPGISGGTGTDFTVYFRFKPASTAVGANFRGVLWSKSGFGVQQNPNYSDMLCRMYSTGLHDITASLGDTNWHTIILRWNGSGDDEFSVYTDSVKEGTTHTLATNDNDFEEAFKVGNLYHNPPQSAYSMAGYLDEVAIWDEPLSTDDIALLDSVGIQDFLAYVEVSTATAASAALKATISTTADTGATLGTSRTSIAIDDTDAPRRVHTGRRIVNGKRTGGGRRVSGGRIVGPRAGRGRR